MPTRGKDVRPPGPTPSPAATRRPAQPASEVRHQPEKAVSSAGGRLSLPHADAVPGAPRFDAGDRGQQEATVQLSGVDPRSPGRRAVVGRWPWLPVLIVGVALYALFLRAAVGGLRWTTHEQDRGRYVAAEVDRFRAAAQARLAERAAGLRSGSAPGTFQGHGASPLRCRCRCP